MLLKYNKIVFVGLLLIISVYYNYPEIFTKRPQSVHAWRQSDCASIALNYYQNGMHFFQPEVHNLTSDDGKSGYSATSELPLLYYTVAILYKLFGYHEFIYRLLNTLIFLTGLFYLFRLIYELVQDFFWAAFVPLLLFTSPVLVYYGNNFLSNTTALSMVFIAWFYFFRYIKTGKNVILYASMFFFFLAVSLKITAILSFLAIGGVFIMEWVFRINFLSSEKKLFPSPLKYILSASLVIILSGAWILYAAQYNNFHGSTYFSTVTFPVWELSKEAISAVIENIKKIWIYEYFHFSVYLILGIFFLYAIVRLRKSSRFIFTIILFSTVGITSYILLQFGTFRDHDYYTINLYIFPAFLSILFIDALLREFPRLFSSKYLKSIFFLVLIFNVHYAKTAIDKRYNGWWMDSTKKLQEFYSITPYLREIGVNAQDTVISIAGNSHVSLYLMNQKGWTEHTDKRFGHESEINYNQDSNGIAKSIKNGAKYLIVNGISQFHLKPYLRPYAFDLIGRYNEILIFDLLSDKKNFEIENLNILSTMICDAEKLTADSSHFVGSPDSVFFEFGNLQSARDSHSGKYSIALNSSSPYGMTVLLPVNKFAEKIEITVWLKPFLNDAGIIVSTENTADFYHFSNSVIAEDSAGWRKISSNVFIDSNLEGKALKVYLYSPTDKTVYFDDLIIQKYGLDNP